MRILDAKLKLGKDPKQLTVDDFLAQTNYGYATGFEVEL